MASLMTKSLHYYSLDKGSREDEIRRLNTQYKCFQYFCGNEQGAKLPLHPSKVDVILDIATGTGSWLLDIARGPSIASRLSSPTDKLKLLACDLSLSKLSPELASYSASNPKIRIFEHDVTQPFPAGLHGTVDLVHMSLLVLALTQKGWETALKNIYDILKPGGRLLLMEYDLSFYSPAFPPFALVNELQECMAAARVSPKVLDRFNVLFSNMIQSQGRTLGVSYRIPGFLKSAEFFIVSSRIHSAPVGLLCQTQPSPNGAPLSEFTDFTVENIIRLADLLVQEAVASHDPNAGSDFHAPTKEEKEKLFSEFAEFARTQWVYSLASEWIAQKIA